MKTRRVFSLCVLLSRQLHCTRADFLLLSLDVHTESYFNDGSPDGWRKVSASEPHKARRPGTLSDIPTDGGQAELPVLLTFFVVQYNATNPDPIPSFRRAILTRPYISLCNVNRSQSVFKTKGPL